MSLAAVVILVLAVVMFAIVAVAWRFADDLVPKNLTTTDLERLKLVHQQRVTLLQFGAAAVVVATLASSYAEYRRGREALITDRFAKAFDHISDKIAVVRVGGIFELSRIMRDAPDDACAIGQMLNTFIGQSGTKGLRPPTDRDHCGVLDLTQRRPDKQMALSVLSSGAISKAKCTRALTFDDIDLCGAALGGAELGGAMIHRSRLRSYLADAHLEYMFGEKVDFNAATMTRVHLNGSTLWYAQFCHADLRAADLSEAKLWWPMFGDTTFDRNTNFKGAQFYEADFSGIDEGARERLKEATCYDYEGHSRDCLAPWPLDQQRRRCVGDEVR